MSITTNKLFSIVGTTATGKTSLALKYSQIISQEYPQIKGTSLISADSRQVYIGLETLTGTDVPSNFNQIKKKPYPYFASHNKQTTLHGVSIIYPDQDWSVAHFRGLAIRVIKQSWKHSWLPIVVGGTGFYHQQLFNNDPNPYIKPNTKIRTKAEKISVKGLQQWLSKVNQKKIESMNQSDRNNPRRLIRAIEVSLGEKEPNSRIKNRPQFQQPKHYGVIGLKNDELTLKKKIKERVKKRFMLGAVEEVKNLLALNLDDSNQAMTATGVRPLTRYIHHDLTAQEAMQAWTQEEMQYAKRQLTWFKKHQKPQWFNPQDNKFKKQVTASFRQQLSLKTK